MTNKPTHQSEQSELAPWTGAITEAIEYLKREIELSKELYLRPEEEEIQLLQKLEALRDAVPNWRKDRLHPMQAEGKSYKLLHEALQDGTSIESEG